MKNYVVSINDLEVDDVQAILDLAIKMKASPDEYGQTLKGKIFGLIFEKPSTRTWISFETGIFSLGGGSIYLGPEDIKLGQREEVRDVARVLERYLAGVILRTFSHETITSFQEHFTRPVINGLSNFEHPCQALGDYLTIREKFGDVRKPTLAFIGDGNNVLNSLILLAAKLGCKLHCATPKNRAPSPDIIKKAKEYAGKTGAVINIGTDPAKAVRGADVVYTDVWISMGEEQVRREKIKDFQGYQVNEALMKQANAGAAVMHCLPAHRGEEITNEVIESKDSIVFDQAENRLHVQKALLATLCSYAHSADSAQNF